jgi:uncharacterized OB-fold protein
VSAPTSYLPPGLPAPQPQADGVDAPFWAGLRHGRLLVQRCPACGIWQFGPEWLCHRCHRFDPDWTEVEPRGRIYSWARVWHPAHAALRQSVPYRVVLVELDDASGIRLLGNLLGTPTQAVEIGAAVEGVFEPHEEADPPYTLLQWQQRIG